MTPEQLEERLPPGFRARYRLGEQLGAGATAQVYRAHQLALARDVVVKLLWDAGRGGPEVVERTLQEARLLSELVHPHVVALLDHGVEGELLYLTYPDEGGRPLRDLMEAGRPGDPSWVEEVLRQSLEGLAYLHGRGVLHRDLKPENLLVVGGREIRLIDLGLAKDLAGVAALTRTGAFLGTPTYMAPEQLEGETPDPRDDLYALGVIAYELAAGANPFRGPDLQQTAMLHQIHVPPRLDRQLAGFPPRLAGLVAGLLGKRRKDRPASAAVALARLRGEGVDESGEADVTDPLGETDPATAENPRLRTDELLASPPPGQAARRLPLLAWAALGGVLALLGRAGVARLQGRGRPAPLATSVASARPQGPPPGTPPARFDAAFVAAAEDELRQAQRWSIDARGVPVKALVDPFRTPPPFLSPDPLRALALDRELAVAASLRAWLLAGGLPESLPEEVRAGLRRVDGGYAAAGTARPFFPFLHLGPRPDPVAIPEGFPAGARHPSDASLSGEVSGWLGTAMEAFGRADVAREALRQPLESPDGELGRLLARLAPQTAGRSPLVVLERVSPPPELRERIGDMTRECAAATWEFLYAASRHLRLRGPEVRDHAVLLARGIEKLGPAFLSPLGVLPAERVLGGPVAAPAEWLLAARLDVRAAQAAQRLGLDPGERWGDAARRLRKVLELGEPDAGTRRLRGAAAPLYLFAIARRDGVPAALAAHEREAKLFEDLDSRDNGEVALLLTGISMGGE